MGFFVYLLQVIEEMMDLQKWIIQPLDEYLNNWFGSLPFEALEDIFGVVLLGSMDTEEELRLLEEDWLSMGVDDKVGIHSEYWEKYEKWSSHLIPPSVYIPYDD